MMGQNQETQCRHFMTLVRHNFIVLGQVYSYYLPLIAYFVLPLTTKYLLVIYYLLLIT